MNHRKLARTRAAERRRYAILEAPLLALRATKGGLSRDGRTKIRSCEPQSYSSTDSLSPRLLCSFTSLSGMLRSSGSSLRLSEIPAKR